MPKRYVEIPMKVYWFQRNSRRTVAVTSASPKAVVMAHALLVLLVGGVCKFDLDYVSEVMG